MLIALLLLFVLVGVFFLKRNVLLKSFSSLILSALLITLLVSPYLYNYDFILLLVPFTLFINEGNLLQKIVIILCYFVPTFVIALYGRAGNISLLIVTLVITALLYLRIKSQVDVPAFTTYNTNK